VRRLAAFVLRARWWIIAITVMALPVAAFFGSQAIERLTSGGFADPGSESAQAAATLDQRFEAGDPNFVVVVTADDGSVDDEAVVAAGQALTEELGAEDGVADVSSYWSLGSAPPLRSTDSTQALVLARLDGSEDEVIELAGELSPAYSRDGLVISTEITGAAEVARQVSEQAEEDLAKAESITVPITFIALVIVFGSLVAALLPLSVGIVAVIGTLLILYLLTLTTDVSVFALNLTTSLGLGLAIDYSLFVVSRYREELRNGVSREVALSRTMQTAGRTVAFSAGTVMVSMLALLIFPMPYLRSFAYAGTAVVALSAFAAIVILPAVLAVLGPKIEKGRIFHRKEKDPDEGFWHDQAWRVMRHPIPYAVGVIAILLVLAAPFLHLKSGSVDERVLPEGASSRESAQDIREGFTGRESAALQVLLEGVDAEADAEAIDAYAVALAAVRGVDRVDAVTGYYLEGQAVPANELSQQRFGGGPGTWLSVVPSVEPVSPEGEQLVADIRAVDAPGEASVAGTSAQLVDLKASVASLLPWALLLVAVSTFVLLFFMVGSLLVPFKALVLNVLSLSATFGSMVWIFQDGHLSDALGFTATGTTDVTTPVLMFCIAFGLSMDYEVFLLSRIKEEYDLDRDNERAVALGLQRTGGIVTAAAILMSIVFLGVATSQVSVVKLLGVGLTVAVLVDAFLIRATLVPAFMRLAGRANWWAPKPLRRLHLRYGIWENEPIAILEQQQSQPTPDAAEDEATQPPQRN
jgi:RND superfamily putative drug exporter